MPAAPIDGHVAPGFEPVRDEFARNFAKRDELGSGCAAVIGGERVVDLWGGTRDETTGEPWQEETLSLIFSTTKGLSATAIAIALARSWLELDQPVARYWPEFAQNGKEGITVRNLLMHRAGLPVISERLTHSLLSDPDSLAVVLARQHPRWRAGDAHGYHAVSLGFYLSELLRRVDPGRRSIGGFLRTEINPALGTDLHIGLPRDVPSSSVAKIRSKNPLHAIMHAGKFPLLAIAGVLWPWSMVHRAALNPWLRRPGDLAETPLRHLELPSSNGLATARDLATLFGDLACGGIRLGLDQATMIELKGRPEPPLAGWQDKVMHMPLLYSNLGFFLPGPTMRFGSSRRAFGSPGIGGTFAYADPDLALGYGYITNRMGYYLFNDPREKSLRDAIVRCVRRHS